MIMRQIIYICGQFLRKPSTKSTLVTMAKITVKSFEDIWAVLEPYKPRPQQQAEVYKLDNMRELMQYFGNPQDTFKAVHVAGTSGKTSTAYYIAAMLSATGKRVGLTVSPHVDGVNERVQINMSPLSEARYCTLFGAFMTKFQSSGLHATVFEILVSFAYWVFAKEKVDYAVIEVGLGGLLDGTNVINRPDKTCVITDLGLDHTEVLGKTISEIASQKAGIIHPHNQVFMYDQGDEIMDVVREVCDQQQATLHEIWQLQPHELPSQLPLVQRRNWYLALNVAQSTIEDDTLTPLTSEQLATTTTTRIPGRIEIIERGNKTVVLDGAHNAQKMEMLAKSLKQRFQGARFTVVFGLVRSKNFRIRTSVESILPLGAHIIITSFNVGQEFQRISTDPAKVAEHCHMVGYDNWEIIADPFEAYAAALASDQSDIVLVTGSFYLLDHLRSVIWPAKTIGSA